MNFTQLFGKGAAVEEAYAQHYLRFLLPFNSFFRQQGVNMFFLFLAALMTVANLKGRVAFAKTQPLFTSAEEGSIKSAHISTSGIKVEVVGSVAVPGVYAISTNTRLEDVIKEAGGLSSEADDDFIARNFNMARYVSDQEKIYIPSRKEVEEGIFIEEKQVLDYLKPVTVSQEQGQMVQSSAQSYVSLNQATLSELDTLPGIGQVTAQKIIDGRPYQSIDEILNRHTVSTSVFNKIKSMISL